MAPLNALGPFRPGFGGQPPYLAGRETEQRLLRRYLGAVSSGAAPGTAVVLHGPRGNGKTVLLGWLEAEADQRVKVSQVTPSKLPDRTGLAEELLSDSWWAHVKPSQVSVAGTGMTWRPGSARPPSVEAVLATRARRKPLLLLLDEAHTLDPELGGELLDASQQVARRLPFLLVLAGTPNLPSNLARMSASFWNRARQVRVGRPSEEASAEGLRRPLEAENISVPEDLLAFPVRESQGYPFFVQLLGDAVWQDIRFLSGGRRVTRAVLDAALPAFEETKNDLYRERYRELEALDLLRVGRSVANAFGARRLLGDLDLREAIAKGLGTRESGRILAARKSLLRSRLCVGTGPGPGVGAGDPEPHGLHPEVRARGLSARRPGVRGALPEAGARYRSDHRWTANPRDIQDASPPWISAPAASGSPVRFLQ